MRAANPAFSAASTQHHSRVVHALAWSLVLLLAGASVATAQGRESFQFDGRSLSLGNLIGKVEIEPARGGGFEVEVDVQGRDAASAGISFDRTSSSLVIVFPDENSFVYPELGRGTTTINMRRSDGSSSLLREILRSVTGRSVKVRGSGSGTEVWVDVVVRVPDGASFELEHGVGSIVANGVSADLDLDISSGGIEANDIRGRLEADTGSGALRLADIDGDLFADTGSGNIDVAGVRAGEVSIDTGSGRVEISDIDADRLEIDTGSGGVEASGIRASSAMVDTGSGSVVLEMLGLDGGDYEIDTGSGSITLLMPESVSADVLADTGSGGISVDLPGIQTLHRERDQMRFKVGGGDARVRLDTGSGRIRVAALD